MDEQVKIWQRVRPEATPVTDGLPGLAANAISQANLYGSLARQAQGSRRNLLLKLQEEERRCAQCLKGIYRMATGTPMTAGSVPLSPENTEAALRKCYGQCLKALALFDSRAFHPEYGPVFAQLAAKKREHCCTLTELLGF